MTPAPRPDKDSEAEPPRTGGSWLDQFPDGREGDGELDDGPPAAEAVAVR